MACLNFLSSKHHVAKEFTRVGDLIPLYSHPIGFCDDSPKREVKLHKRGSHYSGKERTSFV